MDIIQKYKHFVYLFIFCVVTVSRGQSAAELQQLKTEYEKYQKNRLNPEQQKMPLEGLANPNYPMEVQVVPYTPDDLFESDDDEPLYYGYDFFTQRDTVSFWENLPAPSNYLLGSGDEIIISLWGQTQIRQNYIISREGNIYDEKVGLISLGGLSIDGARDFLLSQFSQVYSTLIGDTPSTYINISLGELRSINVNFVGEINYPGVYPIHPFSNVISGLIQSGGVNTQGSLRNIQIKREGEIISTVDLYDFFINGEFSKSIQLRDQDVIVVPTRKSYVFIDSSVVNQGIYEALTSETVFDLIGYAGGPTYDASSKVGIRRLLPKPERSLGNIYESSYIEYENTHLIQVNSGDRITVLRLFDELDQVEIIGQVKAPGIYHHYDGMRLLDLFSLSGGFQDSTFLNTVYLNQLEIIRRDPNDRYEKIIKVDLKELLKSKKGNNVLLKNLDRVVVHANLNFFEKENISLLGEVKVPGAYPLIKDDESLQSLINRAGGLTTKALNNGIEIYRNNKFFDSKLINREVIRNSELVNQTENLNYQETFNPNENQKVRVAWQDTQISLMPGDSIIVKEKTSTVFVMGQVYNPGAIEFRSGKPIRYYLNAAGGLNERGFKKGIVIIYPNGVVKPKKIFQSPKVTEGSTIYINEKAIQEPFDLTQFATNWTSIVSSIVTTYILSKQL